jgi:hypothetical protein
MVIITTMPLGVTLVVTATTVVESTPVSVVGPPLLVCSPEFVAAFGFLTKTQDLDLLDTPVLTFWVSVFLLLTGVDAEDTPLSSS